MCDIFDDEDDRLWSSSRFLLGVIESNAPVKKKILQKLSVSYINSHLWQAVHKKNMLRNAYRKRKSQLGWLRKAAKWNYSYQKATLINISLWTMRWCSQKLIILENN